MPAPTLTSPPTGQAPTIEQLLAVVRNHLQYHPALSTSISPYRLTELERRGTDHLFTKAGTRLIDACQREDPGERLQLALEALLDLLLALHASNPAVAADAGLTATPHPHHQDWSAESPTLQIEVGRTGPGLPRPAPVPSAAPRPGKPLSVASDASPPTPQNNLPPPLPKNADQRDPRIVLAEQAAIAEHADKRGTVILVTCLLINEQPYSLQRPRRFTVINSSAALSLVWQGDWLLTRWQVMPCEWSEDLPNVQTFQVAGHRHGIDGQFAASRHFTEALESAADLIPQAPATPVPLTPLEKTVSPAHPAPVAALPHQADHPKMLQTGEALQAAERPLDAVEARAMAQYEKALGQIIESCEVRGKHVRLGDEVLRFIPPVHLRVIATPRHEILTRREGVLRPVWRVEAVELREPLAEMSDLCINAPIPGEIVG